MTGSGSDARTDIALGALVIDADTTVATFAEAVVENNSLYEYGDQISFFYFVQTVDVTTETPIIRAYGWRVNLSATDTTRLAAVGGGYGFATQSGYLGISSATSGDCAFCWVHSRKTSGGKTLVSSQRLIANNSILATYTAESAKTASMESYGLGDEAFITPDGTSEGSSNTSDSGSGSTSSSGSTESGGTQSQDPMG